MSHITRPSTLWFREIMSALSLVCMPDHALRGTTCAVAMQRAMDHVNELNRADGVPTVTMGIGLSTGDVIAGNIGSMQRSTYSVLGAAVNLASRIESFSVGGQVLASERTVKEAGSAILIRGKQEAEAKGVAGKFWIYEVEGVSGDEALMLAKSDSTFTVLPTAVSVTYVTISRKQISRQNFRAAITHISESGARMVADTSLAEVKDLTVWLCEPRGEGDIGRLSARVSAVTGEDSRKCVLKFTASAEEVRAMFPID